MRFLLSVSRLIDAVNERVGRFSYWLILLMVLISAGNAVSRYGLNRSSNAWLEIQWYLFSAVFLLGAGYVMLHNGHVRIDVVASRLRPKVTAWIEIIGIVVFLAPVCWIFLDFGWAMFHTSYASGEMSTDAGGLIRWPVKILVPIGFGLLALQALSELIKRVAFLKGLAEWNPYGAEAPVGSLPLEK
jgi:TRAP-type mannitol/chloroaromatic compound transport system permease small subunit